MQGALADSPFNDHYNSALTLLTTVSPSALILGPNLLPGLLCNAILSNTSTSSGKWVNSRPSSMLTTISNFLRPESNADTPTYMYGCESGAISELGRVIESEG